MTTDKDSVEHTKEFQFKDKVDTLNRDFIKHLQNWYDKCHHSDFSAPINSYKQHMKSLEDQFNIHREKIKDSHSLTETMVSTPSAGRKIVKAKRRTDKAVSYVGDQQSISISTPVKEPPRMSFGNVSAITVDRTPVPYSPDKTLTTIIENKASVVASGGGRKRAIRGGGPLGGSESVVFRGSDNQASSDNKSIAPVVNVPKFTPGFWGKKNDQSDNNSPFSFGKSLTGDALSQKTTDGVKDLSFPGFGAPNVLTATSSNFPTFGSGNSATSKLGFGQTTQSGTSATNPAPALSFPSFGSTSGATPFSFGSLPKSSEEKKDGDGEDDAEYVPPKADVVENEEPDATYSTKCSVFKMVDKQYTKLGVGMLHLKETDSKHSLLIRAATATGTVWLNSLINKSMKAVKADDKGEKLRIICPISEKEIATYLVRFANSAALEKVLKNIESNS